MARIIEHNKMIVKPDDTLRPKALTEYIGQAKIKQGVEIIVEAAKKRKEVPEHMLFYGNSGLGKTTLAHIIAHELGVSIKTCSGPALERAGDIASILTNLQEHDILFLDECHRINKSVVEMLYSAMEDFTLHIILGKGPMARTMELTLPKFTLIGATTRPSLLPSPMRNRFGAIFQFDLYEQQDIEQIVERSAQVLGVEIEPKAVVAIATRARSTPRIANRILKRVRDFTTVHGSGRVSESSVKEALDFLEIDEFGLELGDRKILEAIVQKFSGGPVGIQSLAASCAEEEATILDIYEPYLLQLGFVERTPRGRIATKLAYGYLGAQEKQGDLL